MKPISSRRLATPTMAVALSALLALAGCSAEEQPADAAVTSTAGTSEHLPAAQGQTEYPLTLATALGEITVEERPERVAMASSWDGDLFAALGVTPVATDEQIDFYPWVTEALGESETVWAQGDETYPAETIATTSPDLIVDTLAVDTAETEKSADVAPFLGAPEATGDASTWQERILLLGEVLDLSDRAQQVIDDYDASFETVRTEHPEFAGKTVDYLAFYGADYAAGLLNIAGSDAEQLFTRMGFAPNPLAEETTLEEGVSDELLGTLQGDVLVISNQDAENFAAFYDDPLLQGLESVRNGNVVILDVDSDGWTVSHDGELTDFHGHFGRSFNYGPLAHQELTALLTPLLAQALPAT